MTVPCRALVTMVCLLGACAHGGLDTAPGTDGSTAPGTDGSTAPGTDGSTDVTRADQSKAHDGLTTKDSLAMGDARSGCTPWTGNWTFEKPTSLGSPVNSAADELSPFVTADGLTLYFASWRAGGRGNSDIYVATRASTTASFANVRNLSAVNTSSSETACTLTEDGLVAFLATDAPGGAGGSDLWQATRASTAQPFSAPTPIAALSAAGHEFDPFPSADGLALYFVSHASGQVSPGSFYVATRTSRAAPFGTPALFDAANGATEEGNLSMSRDELVMVWVAESAAASALLLYYSTRSSRTEAFSAPRVLPVLNDPEAHNSESFLTADGCELYFTSDRAGGLGDRDLYHARVVRR